jgi:hypothetical protein
MQAVAYEGYFNNGRFYSAGKVVLIPEKQRVFITILEDAQDAETYNMGIDNETPQEWLDDLFSLLQTASNELNESDFPRLDFGRGLIDFNIEEMA